MSERILIFDTTLRDGEQSPGATMNQQEKLQLARQLEKLGVDIIEAGFPASSEGDKESVSKMIEWCHQGPPAARVTKVHQVWEEYTGEFEDFSVTY